MLQDYIATGHEPHLPQELMRMDFLENIGQEIVGLCDRIEQHGLVDYQMGVWEEEIIECKFPGMQQRWGEAELLSEQL